MNNHLATYTMTVPPSVNSAYRAFRGRVIMSKPARLWYANTIPNLFLQKNHATITQDIFLSIKLSPKTKAKQDIDNRNKCIFDALVKANIIQDDSQVKKLLIEFDYTKKDFVSVEIHAYP
jgi:Holliday junction resolvase RusA-like endonuclease